MPVAGTAPPPMPGPATQWQAAAPATAAPPGAPPNGNSWSWSQPSNAAPPPSMQQYGNQLQAQANQFQQGMQGTTNQMQQAMPQMPAGPQQQTANGNWWPFSNTSGMPPARAVPVQPARY
jgi:hypothetical protein